MISAFSSYRYHNNYEIITFMFIFRYFPFTISLCCVINLKSSLLYDAHVSNINKFTLFHVCMIFQNSHQNEETRCIFLLEKIHVLHKIKRAKYRFNRNTQGSCHQHIYCSLKTWRTQCIFTSRHCWLLVSICVWAQSWWIPVCVGKVTG